MLLTVDEPATHEQLKAENVTLRAELARLSTLLEAARSWITEETDFTGWTTSNHGDW